MSKSTRLKKGLTLEEIEKGTKIRVKFLRALEEGDYTIFHSMPYARGFLKNYAEFLGIDVKLILAFFRRETGKQNIKIIPHGMVGESFSWFRITPTRAALIVALFMFAAVGYYLFGEYKGFLGSPSVSVNNPSELSIIKEGEIEVAGKVDVDSTVFVNGEPATITEPGYFTKRISVFKGEEEIIVTAKNRRGKETTIIRHIKVEENPLDKN